MLACLAGASGGGGGAVACWGCCGWCWEVERSTCCCGSGCVGVAVADGGGGRGLLEKRSMVATRLGCGPTEVGLLGRLVMRGVELE